MAKHALLEAYRPTSDDPFDDVKAAHLLNRAGFGGTPEEIAKVRSLGPQDAVDSLLDFPDAPVEEQSRTDVPELSSIDGYPSSFRELRQMYAGKSQDERKELQQKFMAANREALQATVRWWLHRMAYGPYPLQEKLTLFWHGHFTTSAKDERSALLMWRQNELLRRNAAGNFRQFVHAVSRDPAMLDYLNNTQNRKAHANENYARELMELFTLGIGNYTETDVKQGARAFTGWSHDGQDYIFNRNQHDTGIKTFLGHTGNFDGDDVIDIILSQPACPRFIASKLWKLMAFEDVDDSLGAALASSFVENEFELRPLLRTILTSRGFYSTQSIGAQIKSPVQLIAGTVRMLGIDLPPEPRLVGALVAMGQMPMLPPNVRGWPGGQLWINTSTLFVRYNTGVWLAGGSASGVGAQGKLKGIGRVGGPAAGATTNFAPKPGSSAEQVVDEWVGRLIQRPIDPGQRQTLIDSLGGRPDSEQAVRTMVQLIVSMPEYQLC